MNLRAAHGLNEDEIKKYAKIITSKYVSIAEYKANVNDKMSSFSHKHLPYEFIIPFNLMPLLIYQDALYIGEVGYCYPVNPNTNHGIDFDLNSSVISIVVDMEYLDKLKKELNYDGKYFYTKFLVSKDLLNILSMVRVTQDINLMEELVKILIIDGLKENADTRKPSYYYFKNMKKSIMYMLDNYENPDLTIEEVASKSDYSYTYFTKAFKRYMNDTPVNHLNRIRLSKAKELIKNKELSLSDIALKAGFKTQSNFTEVFKRIVGMKPTEYRKKYL